MADWSVPTLSSIAVMPAHISSFDNNGRAPVVDLANSAGIGGNAVWPAANRAIFQPFLVNSTVTAYQMGFLVAVQSGNYDIGIYDYNQARLVSTGSTGVPAAGPAVANIADTVLTPGHYFMALCIDNTTASVLRINNGSLGTLSASGIQDQDIGAVTLPNPATFSAPGSVYTPLVVVSCRSTM